MPEYHIQLQTMRKSLAIFLTLMSVAPLSAQTQARGSAGVAVAGVVQDQTGAIKRVR